MANMSYCRFRNTLPDLQDCYENMDEMDLDEEEFRARIRLIELCCLIANEFAEEVEEYKERRVT